jgi:SAM-dependent methyltransferase
MRYCPECGFVWNTAFDPDRVRYDQSYENAQTHSAAFQEYVDALARHLLDECRVRRCRILEVGCGNGSFLRKLIGAAGAGNTGVGYDPAHRNRPEEFGGRLQFRSEFLTGEPLEDAFDVVICRHVIEHVPQPVSFLKALRGALAGSRSARIFLETPCVEWILGHHTFWDLFHEHCSLFTASALRTACAHAGISVTAVRPVFGNQYLWLEGTLAAQGADEPTRNAGDVPIRAREFAAAEREWRRIWRAALEHAPHDRKLAVWGAGAKGVTLLNLIDPHIEHVCCVVDVNPLKQGGYVPGTGHPIIAPHQLAEWYVETILVMNPNYREEITQTLHALGLNVLLMDPHAPAHAAVRKVG